MFFTWSMGADGARAPRRPSENVLSLCGERGGERPQSALESASTVLGRIPDYPLYVAL